MNHCKSYFASANTGKGFINCFSSINSGEGFQYILKGAPGCGKNSLMSKVAQSYLSHDVHIEYFYCSSDPKSLDGIRLVEPELSIVDGTAPHVTECRFPGLTHKLVDLGVSVRSGLETIREQLFLHEREKKEGYALLYKYLSAAESILDADLSRMPLKDIATDSIQLPNIKGAVRHLFLSSVEKDLTDLNYWSDIITIDTNTRSADALFHKIESICKTQGLSVTCILNTINPNIYDALYVADTDTLYKAEPISDSLIDELIKRSAAQLAINRSHHLDIEKTYRDFIDYNMVNSITTSLLQEVDKSFNR